MLRAIAHPWALRRGQDSSGAPVFKDRADGGARLAERLSRYRSGDALVLGIPRGGVPVAAAVARGLGGELDIVVARKLAAPISPELAIGAVTADGGRFLNEAMIQELGVDDAYLAQVTRAQVADAKRREARFRGGTAAPRVTGRTVILVDDGLATGATMIAAARSVRAQKPARLVVAVPVGSREACRALEKEADEVVCLTTPDPFWAVGLFYEDFGQTEDGEVEQLLRDSRTNEPPVAVPGA